MSGSDSDAVIRKSDNCSHSSKLWECMCQCAHVCPYRSDSDAVIRKSDNCSHSHRSKLWECMCQCAHVCAYGLKTDPAFCMFLSWGRGGVGWGGLITFICTSSHI